MERRTLFSSLAGITLLVPCSGFYRAKRLLEIRSCKFKLKSSRLNINSIDRYNYIYLKQTNLFLFQVFILLYIT